MARRVFVLPVRDFTGGINYNADAFQLKDTQVSDALNVDFDPNGGFRRRDAAQAINSTAITNKPKNIWSFCKSDASVKQIIAQDGNDAAYSTGGNFTSINPDALTLTGTMFAATVNDKNYIQRNAEQVAFTWDGAASAVLADSHGAYNDNWAAPAGGKMPKAKYIVSHLNYLFHANINEGGTQRRLRLRFSHPFSDLTGTKGVEDYRTNDWIEVPATADEITGIVSWQKQLIIFCNNSVWLLRGFGPDSFQLENVTKRVGAVGQRAITVGDEGVYFFSWNNGLQLFDGSSVKDLWYDMTPLTAPGGIGTLIDGYAFDTNLSTNTTVGYVNQRVWISFTVVGGTTNSVTLVFDPRLGKHGGYTRYDLPLGAYMMFHPPGGDRTWYAVNDAQSSGRVLKLHATGTFTDTLVTTPVAVSSWCITKWFDLGNPALVKRWKHPIFVCDGGQAETLSVDVYRDYDLSGSVRNFQLTIANNDAGTKWGTSTWGGGTWSSASSSATQTIERGGLLGRGTAIAVKVTGPATGDLPWSVNSITLKYIPKRIRS